VRTLWAANSIILAMSSFFEPSLNVMFITALKWCIYPHHGRIIFGTGGGGWQSAADRRKRDVTAQKSRPCMSGEFPPFLSSGWPIIVQNKKSIIKRISPLYVSDLPRFFSSLMPSSSLIQLKTSIAQNLNACPWRRYE
jgi:hypothetical protein